MTRVWFPCGCAAMSRVNHAITTSMRDRHLNPGSHPNSYHAAPNAEEVAIEQSALACTHHHIYALGVNNKPCVTVGCSCLIPDAFGEISICAPLLSRTNAHTCTPCLTPLEKGNIPHRHDISFHRQHQSSLDALVANIDSRWHRDTLLQFCDPARLDETIANYAIDTAQTAARDMARVEGAMLVSNVSEFADAFGGDVLNSGAAAHSAAVDGNPVIRFDRKVIYNSIKRNGEFMAKAVSEAPSDHVVAYLEGMHSLNDTILSRIRRADPGNSAFSTPGAGAGIVTQNPPLRAAYLGRSKGTPEPSSAPRSGLQAKSFSKTSKASAESGKG